MDFDKAAEEARKAKYDADAAETAAKKAAREEEEGSSVAAVARREAIAEKDAAAARREQIAAIVPDFGKIERGALGLSGDEPTAGTAVAGRALHKAAEQVKDRVVAVMGSDGWSLLITSDSDLAGSDAAYQNTLAGLGNATEWATQVLAGAERVDAESQGEGFALTAVAGAIATAIPGVLSLLSAHRTVTTGKVTIDDLAATAALAGVLKGQNAKRRVFHDSVRPLPVDGDLSKRIKALNELRRRLIERKVALEALKPTDGAVTTKLAETIALIAKVSEAIDTMLATLVTVPAGATRSPLSAAILREGLHDGTFKHVLFAKAQSASGMQLVNDKPLWSKDTFAVLAAASISWLLVASETGEVLDAGVTTGAAQAHGRVGDTFEFD